MQTVCVFCGSAKGDRPVYAQAAQALGHLLAARGLSLVYGGGHVGLMGVIADATLEAGGKAIGVIPQALVARELAHSRLTELHVTDTMHQRKALMADRADAFVALPGGFGTLDELFEIITWAQLGLHGKPVGLLNVAGFFDPLLAWIDQVVREGFVRPVHRHLIHTAEQPEVLLDALQRAGTRPVPPTEVQPSDR